MASLGLKQIDLIRFELEKHNEKQVKSIKPLKIVK